MHAVLKQKLAYIVAINPPTFAAWFVPMVEGRASVCDLARVRDVYAGCEDMRRLHVQWAHHHRHHAQLLCHRV